MVLNKEIYDWSSKLHPFQHPHSPVIVIQTLGREPAFTMVTAFYGHMITFDEQYQWGNWQEVTNPMTWHLMTHGDSLTDCSKNS